MHNFILATHIFKIFMIVPFSNTRGGKSQVLFVFVVVVCRCGIVEMGQ
jgi:hypothetical protein